MFTQKASKEEDQMVFKWFWTEHKTKPIGKLWKQNLMFWINKVHQNTIFGH